VYAGDLAEIVDGVGGVHGAAADAHYEQAASTLAQRAEERCHSIQDVRVERGDDAHRFVEVLARVRFGQGPCSINLNCRLGRQRRLARRGDRRCRSASEQGRKRFTQDLGHNPVPLLVEVSVDGMIELRSNPRTLPQIVCEIENGNAGSA
jgi:hypothetical protein